MSKVDDYEAVVETLEELLDAIDNLPSHARSCDFVTSVEASACDMKKWIEENEVATESQENAANNWLAAVRRLDRDD